MPISSSGYDNRAYQIVVLGASEVGKTQLISRAVADCFNQEYDATIEDTFRKDIQLPNGSTASLEFLDTSGAAEFADLTEERMRTGQAFAIMYSTTSLDSFEAAKKIYKKLVSIRRSRRFPLVLIGTKCDLEHQRDLPDTKGEKLAQSWRCPFFETSAKERIRHLHCFVKLAELLQQQRDDEHTRKKTSDTLRSSLFQRRFSKSKLKKLGQDMQSAAVSLLRRVSQPRPS